MLQKTTPCSQTPQHLSDLKDCARPLLIFAPAPTDAVFTRQMAMLRGHADALRERDILVVAVVASGNEGEAMPPEVPSALMSETEQTALRKRFKISRDSFTALLVGKDGGEKLRRSAPISLSTLTGTIDAMPMRQDEMHRQP